MKKLLFAASLLLGAAPVLQAQPHQYVPGVLRVQLADNSPIVIGLDGRHIDTHGTSLTVTDIPSGRHYLKVYSYSAYPGGGGGAHLIYQGMIHIFRDAGTSVVLDATTGALDIERMPYDNAQQQGGDQYAQGQQPPMNDQQYQGQQPQGNNGDNYSYNNNGYGNNSADTAPPAGDYNADNDSYNDGNNTQDMASMPVTPKGNYPEADYPPLTQAATDNLGTKVSAKKTDTDKLKLIETTLAKKSFTVGQVSTMMSWMIFEDSKLALAKWAWSRTSDKENYRTLEGDLTYSNNKLELDKYINAN